MRYGMGLTLFWLDRWTGEGPLHLRFPHLFVVCDEPSLSVASAIRGEVRLRRSLDQADREQWATLQTIIAEITTSDGQGEISWALEPSVRFSVKSMYAKLSQGATVAYHKDMWAAKLPHKIKIFSWQLAIDRLPSSLNIANRYGPANNRCVLCGQPEDASHIHFLCSIAKFAWSAIRQLLGVQLVPGLLRASLCYYVGVFGPSS